MGGQFVRADLECSPDGLEAEYARLVYACRYESGHGGYTGTFAEKPDMEIIEPPNGATYWTAVDADIHALENNNKWGAAYVYRLGETTWYAAGWASS